MQVLHMSGAGNDFMVVDARELSLDFSSVARTLCAKTGADGFMALDYSELADFKLHFYNSDGHRGEMCGNGARCICRFASELGIAGDTMTVETDAGLVPGWRLDDGQYRVQLNSPSVIDFSRKDGCTYVELGNPGIPHCVQEIPALSWTQADELRNYARALRYDPAFPKGVNVNFYTWLNETSIRILTYERYVEDYTLACGTGCGSVATVLFAQGKLPGGMLTAHNKGGILRLQVSGREGKVDTLFLDGPTEILAYYEV